MFLFIGVATKIVKIELVYNSSVLVVLIFSYWRLAITVYMAIAIAYSLSFANIGLLFASKILIFMIES